MKKVICFPFIGDSFGGSHQSSLVIIKLKVPTKTGFILKKQKIDFPFSTK